MTHLRIALLALVGVLWSSAALAQAPVIPCVANASPAPPGGCTPVATTAPLPVAIYSGGSTAQVSLDGAMSVNTPASPQLNDTFSAALDTTTLWTLKNSTGTAATSGGQLVINSSTTASAWGGVSSQQSFAPVGVSPQLFGVSASFTVPAQANSVRVWGVFTVPTTPTIAVPATDGYLFRLNGAGALFAEVWAGGVAVSSTDVTALCLGAANVPTISAINYRTSLIQFICGTSTAAPVALVPFTNPTNQVLPVSALSIAGSTPPGASAVMNLSAIALATLSPASVKSAGQNPNENDAAGVVAAKQYSFDGINWNKSAGLQVGVVGAPGVDVVAVQSPITSGSAGYPTASTPITGNAAGTTGAVVGTLAAVSAKTTYICGFNVQAVGGVASVGPVTIAGLVGSSQVYQTGINSTATGQVAGQPFWPCLAASAANTPITITTTADGTATAVNVNSWGFQQ